MKIYVVNYRNTIPGQGAVKVTKVDSGVYGKGYLKIEDARRKCCEMVDDLYNALLRENEQDLFDYNERIYDDSSEDGNRHCFHYYDDVHEYWVQEVEVGGL
jgi:hypothetical protein